MNHLTLVVLLTLAPLSWGEDVWYCVGEAGTGVEQDQETAGYSVESAAVEADKFKFKYEADQERLVLKVTGLGDEAFYLPCEVCVSKGPHFNAKDGTLMFKMSVDRRFMLSLNNYSTGFLLAGTCTKF